MEKSDKVSSYTPELDLPSRESGLGGEGTSTYTIFNGLNIQGGKPVVPPNVDDQGLVFFTRPAMNLSYDNVKNIRSLASLSNRSKTSGANALRCLLSPPRELNYQRGFANSRSPARTPGSTANAKGESDRSAIIRDKLPFITPLSNTLQSLSGWPDWNMDTYTSPEGYQKEQVSWADDFASIYGAFDLTASFYQVEGSPVLDLMEIWLNYMTRVATGEMGPWPEYVVANRVDYNTKIYRFTLDRSRKFIQKVGCTIAFPTAEPNGAVFNYTDDKPQSEEQNIISIPFRCMGAEYNDPIILYEFNKLQARFNPAMDADKLTAAREAFTVRSEGNIVRINEEARLSQSMIKLRDDEKNLYNYKAYPHIDLDTNEMEWWVEQEEYFTLKKLIEDSEVDEPDIILADTTGEPTFNNIGDKVVA